MAETRHPYPVRPRGRTLSSKEGRQTSRGGRHFRRLFPLRFVSLGLLAGFLVSIFFGIYVVYAEMMSRVTYTGTDIQYDDFWDIPDLMETLDKGQAGGGFSMDLDKDFDDFRKFLEGNEGEDSEGDGIKSTSGPDLSQGGNVKLKEMPGIENILLLGIDTSTYSGRSDIIMIVSINHNTQKISIVSLMRAMYVKIGISRHNWGLLNAAYAYGGPSLAIRTVENNFGIPIKGYVAVNFQSFIRIVNALGGVTINLTEAEGRILGLPSGSNRLTGKQALAYSRIRKIDSDFQRNQRQRNVINSILNEMASSGGASLYKAATVILANTYTNLDLNRYIAKAPTYLAYTRKQMQLPNMSETRMYYVQGQEVWWFDMAKTHKRLTSFLIN